MTTYRKIQEETKRRFGFVPKTRWIADIKARFGLTMRIAPNRQGEDRVHPCPSDKQPALIQVMRSQGVISAL